MQRVSSAISLDFMSQIGMGMGISDGCLLLCSPGGCQEYGAVVAMSQDRVSSNEQKLYPFM